MAEELQQLLEKIQRDGVDKANAEAAAIVAKANAEAAAIVKEAGEKAAADEARAEAAAKASAERAAATIRQAARDEVLAVKRGIEALLDDLLVRNVSESLAAPGAAAKLALDAIKALGTESAEVAAGEKLAAALKAQLAAESVKGITVTTDKAVGAGFSVRLEGGRVEHDFSEAAIAAALARRLRPELAKLLAG